MTKLTLEPKSSSGGPRTQDAGSGATAVESGPVEPGALWGEYVRCGAREQRGRVVLHYEPPGRQGAGRVATRFTGGAFVDGLRAREGVPGVFHTRARVRARGGATMNSPPSGPVPPAGL